MGKQHDAELILAKLGLPKRQCNERSALTLLALAGVTSRANSRCKSPGPQCLAILAPSRR